MYRLGSGPRKTRIVVVGDCYGERDEASGIAFSGPSGHLLTLMLTAAGINRNDCYLTNIINSYPHKGRFDFFSSQLDNAISFLETDIRNIQPNIIIALGKAAFQALTDKTSLEDWRGSILSTPLGKVIGTYHPSDVLRSYDKRAIVELDLAKARVQSHSSEFKEPNYNFNIMPTYNDVMEFANTKHSLLSFDIETLGEHTRCIGFAWSSTDAICIPLIKNCTESQWSMVGEYKILGALDALFSNKDILKIAQNFPFDAGVLARDFGFDIQGLKMDTLLAAHTCYSELPKSLDFLASIYTSIPFWKKHNSKDDSSEFIYNCMDCVATFEIFHALTQELKDLNVFEFYEKHCQPLMLAVSEVGNRGVLIDIEKREALKVQTEIELNAIEMELTKIVG